MTEEEDKLLEQAIEVLERVKDNLILVNNLTGATDRANAMRAEIKEFGWSYIMTLYHPNFNTSDPAAVPLFEMYKYIYNDMKNKGEI